MAVKPVDRAEDMSALQTERSLPIHPIRILQVVGGLNAGGTETWLVDVLRRIDRDEFEMDFLVHRSEDGLYDEEVRRLGSRIFLCLNPSRPLQYARSFRSILREHGPYHVVHSHVHRYTGHVLRQAHRCGVPVRIAHSHTVRRPGESLARRAYGTLATDWIRRHATLGLAASTKSAAALFGPEWQRDPRYSVLHCGIDIDRFRGPVDRSALRRELGIPADAFVVGHVGRFEHPKNHDFLVRIVPALVARQPHTHLLVVGEGPLRPAVQCQVEEMGLAERVTFAGTRPDVGEIMLGGMDVFVFPSRFEGLGLALVEAQASGLACVISDTVPEEADVVPHLVRRLSLSESVDAWAEATLQVGVTRDTQMALRTVRDSSFNIDVSVRELEHVYRSAQSHTRVAEAGYGTTKDAAVYNKL